MNLVLCLLLGVVAATHALLDLPDVGHHHFCLACCGDGCCSDCGLPHHILDNLQQASVKAEKRRVLSARSFIDDIHNGLISYTPDFPDPDVACLACCGSHPCCNNCGLDPLLGHHYPGLTGTTPEPQSPEKDESYGTEGQGQGVLFPGLPDILPNIDPLDLNPAHAYYESNSE